VVPLPGRRPKRARAEGDAGEKTREKEFLPQGVSATPWKGSIRTRESKQIQAFFFAWLCSGLVPAWPDFEEFGFGLALEQIASGN
jgi:hypothetical protein